MRRKRKSATRTLKYDDWRINEGQKRLLQTPPCCQIHCLKFGKSSLIFRRKKEHQESWGKADKQSSNQENQVLTFQIPTQTHIHTHTQKTHTLIISSPCGNTTEQTYGVALYSVWPRYVTAVHPGKIARMAQWCFSVLRGVPQGTSRRPLVLFKKKEQNTHLVLWWTDSFVIKSFISKKQQENKDK